MSKVFVGMTIPQAVFARHAIAEALKHRPRIFDDEQRSALVALANDIGDAMDLLYEGKSA